MTPSAVLSGAAPWAMVHGDCLDVLRILPERSVDHVITDPPYEVEAHTMGRRLLRKTVRNGHAIERVLETAPIAFPPITDTEREAVADQIDRVTRRWAIIFCQVEAAQRWADAFSSMKYKRTCVWIKPDGQPQLSGDKPGMGYESFVAMHAPGRSRWNGGGRVGVFTHNKSDAGGAPHFHPTQKPIRLALELVELFTDPNEIILDPFAGAATFGVAAVRLGRRYIGCEVDARYHALAVERLQAEDSGSDLRAVRAGQLPLLGCANDSSPLRSRATPLVQAIDGGAGPSGALDGTVGDVR